MSERTTYEIQQTETGLTLGTYEADGPQEAIAAMMADAGADGTEPDPGLVVIAHTVSGTYRSWQVVWPTVGSLHTV